MLPQVSHITLSAKYENCKKVDFEEMHCDISILLAVLLSTDVRYQSLSFAPIDVGAKEVQRWTRSENHVGADSKVDRP
jgi:hypothetical protein